MESAAPLALPCPLNLAEIESVARHGRPVTLAPEGRQRLVEVRALLERRLAEGPPMYGINTGFGSLSSVRIDPDGLRDMQRNLIRSHASGVGDPLPPELVRATMLVLAASLARGASGVRPQVVESILRFLDAGITPVVPSRGSVGASGDLAPLAHIALSLLGEGRSLYSGVAEPTGRAIAALGLAPLVLEAKEGLALINGTHLMSALGSLALRDMDRLLDWALVAAAMGIDACRASHTFLDPRLHEVRRQQGQQQVAARLRALLQGSTIVEAHRENDPRVQDPYCLRAMPQVLGAAVDAIEFLRSRVLLELDAVTDNPLVFTEGDRCDVLSGGNFHGMPLAIPLDLAKAALVHVAGISERRTNWLLSATDSQNPVRAHLSPEPGLHSGFMIAQYAAAACCNELQVLAHPASVHNIPTSAGFEDYNSFGPTAGSQLRQSIELTRTVIAIELLVMAEAMEHQRPLRSGPRVEEAVARLRTIVPALEQDRPPAPDIAGIVTLITTATAP
jgi:histidine ammonia-lyase